MSAFANLNGLGKRTTVTNKRAMIPTKVTVKDITGREDKFTLDGNGFQFCRHRINTQMQMEEYYYNEEHIRSKYYSEMEQMLKDV